MRKILLALSLTAAVVATLGLGVLIAMAAEKQYVEPEQTSIEDVASNARTQVEIVPPSAQEMYDLVNIERETAGLGKLKRNAALESSACDKAEDMVKRDYWSHNAPDGVGPWVFIQKNNYRYSEAGENLVYDKPSRYTTSYFHNALMGSQTHRDNIMKASFTEFGICFVKASVYQGENNVYVGVQYFARPHNQ